MNPDPTLTPREQAYIALHAQTRDFLEEFLPDLSPVEMEARLLRCTQVLLGAEPCAIPLVEVTA